MKENWLENDSDWITDRGILILNYSMDIYCKVQEAEDQRGEGIVKLV